MRVLYFILPTLFVAFAVFLTAGSCDSYVPTNQCDPGYTLYTQTDSAQNSNPVYVCFKTTDGKPAVYK